MEREAGIRRRFVLTIANVVAAAGLLGLLSYAFLGLDRVGPRVATASGPTLKIRVSEPEPELTLESVVQVAPVVEPAPVLLRHAIDDTTVRLADRTPVTTAAVAASLGMRRVVIGPDRPVRQAEPLVRQASLGPSLGFPGRDEPARVDDLSAPDTLQQEEGLSRRHQEAPAREVVPISRRDETSGELRLRFSPPDFVIREVDPEDRADLVEADAVARQAEEEKVATKDRRLARERYCMAAAIYYEARGEPRSGQLAVAQVVMNRVASKRYPGTICGVVFQGEDRRNRCQFSFACDGKPERPRPGNSWEQALEIAKSFEKGDRYQAYSRATHYHADYVRPRWSRSMTRIGKIGRHIFLNGV